MLVNLIEWIILFAIASCVVLVVGAVGVALFQWIASPFYWIYYILFNGIFHNYELPEQINWEKRIW